MDPAKVRVVHNGTVREMEPYNALSLAVAHLLPFAEMLRDVGEKVVMPDETRAMLRTFVEHHCSADELRALAVLRDLLARSLPADRCPRTIYYGPDDPPTEP